MPRTSGVYSPPAGTKGTPNTTIESSKYNAFVDDLTTDANAARPVTAGGTGSTNATAARAALGTDNADNLLSGTVADARLPATLSQKTITNQVTIQGNAPIVEWKETDVGGTPSWYGVMDGSGLSFRYQSLSTIALSMRGDHTFQWFGDTIWHGGNDGAGSGLDADLLDGQQGTYYADIPSRLGYTPVNKAGDSFSASIGINAAPGTTLNNGKGIAFGDAGTGIRQNGTGILEFYTSGGLSAVFDNGNFGFSALTFRVNGSDVAISNGGTYTLNINGTASGNIASNAAALGAVYKDITQNMVGSVALLKRTGGGSFNQGDTSIGSALTYSNADGSVVGSSPDGTWLCLGKATGAGSGGSGVTLWKRIA